MTRQERESASVEAVNRIFREIRLDRFQQARLSELQEVAFTATAYMLAKDANMASIGECYANMCRALAALPQAELEAMGAEHVT